MEILLFSVVRASSYLVLSLGFALVFGCGRVLNLSHGAFFLLGAYLAALLGGLPIGAGGAYLGSVLLTGLAGLAFFRLALGRVAGSPDRAMVVCLAANLVLTEALRAVFGSSAVLVPPLLEGSVTLAGVALAKQSLLAVPAALLSLAATVAVVYRTRWGRSFRAVAQDSIGARLMGVNPARVMGWTFAAGAALAACAACLLAPLTVVTPWGWVSPLLKSFAVVVLAGPERFARLAGAALLLAVVEVAGSLLVSEGVAELFGLLVILAVLATNRRGRLA
jgi:branched-chain amino acid transport system permease protein